MNEVYLSKHFIWIMIYDNNEKSLMNMATILIKNDIREVIKQKMSLLVVFYY